MSRFEFLGTDDAVERIMRFVESVESIPNRHDWYVGTAENADKKLYQEHRAQRNTSISVCVDSGATARGVIKLLIERYGMDGRLGRNDDGRYVYAFKKTVETDPPL